MLRFGPYRRIGRFNKIDYAPVAVHLPLDVGPHVRVVAVTETP